MMRIQLNREEIERALPRVKNGLAKYLWLQRELRDRDVSRDGEYQTKFNGFYRVRRDLPWRHEFFAILEDVKHKRVAIGEILERLHHVTGRMEASFASKLVATVDPSQPVIDSIVFKNLGLSLPRRGEAVSRIERTVNPYRRLAEEFRNYLGSEQGCYLITQFERFYSSSGISEVKMLDFILWQTRQRGEQRLEH
jgi:hypothetical protein